MKGACSSGPVEGARWRYPRTATAAGGTHPTGMHSCYYIIVSYYYSIFFFLYRGMKKVIRRSNRYSIFSKMERLVSIVVNESWTEPLVNGAMSKA